MRGYAVAFFAGGVFTISAEWALLVWSDRRELKKHGQRKGG